MNRWVFLEESTRGGASVTDRRLYCAVQYAHAHFVLCRQRVDAICFELVGCVRRDPKVLRRVSWILIKEGLHFVKLTLTDLRLLYI